MSFYRIYRPQVFEELDNAKVRETLLSFLSKEKKDLPHAFLFSGPRGTGKTTAARLIAKLFQCEKPKKNGQPCGICDQCKAIATGRAMDVIEIDAASNTGVDNIRDLREKIMLAPSVAKWKVYIIDEVHMLSTGAFNALLKTLEEPPGHAVFILATTDVQKVPLTIQSRCVYLTFTRPSVEEVVGALKRIVEKEHIPIDDEALRVIASSADGSFRDAVKFLEQVSFNKGKITSERVLDFLSLATVKTVADFLTLLFEKRDAKEKMKRMFDYLQEVVNQGADMKVFLTQVLEVLGKMLVRGVQGEEPDASNLSSIKRAIRQFTQAFSELRSSPIPQLPIELAIVEFCEEKGEMKEVASVSVQKPVSTRREQEKTEEPPVVEEASPSLGLLTLEKLTECWKDFIEELKPFNHSVAGVLRSSRPKVVSGGIVTIEAFYPFHQEKLSEPKTREVLATVLKKLFGEKVKVEIVLGKK